MALPDPIPQAPAVPYKFYRIFITRNTTGNEAPASGYAAIAEFGIFEEVDSSTNIALASAGAIATADSVTGTNTANRAIDGNVTTDWEASNGPLPHWLRIELPAARVAKKFSLVHTTWPGELPSNFRIEGSNDGSTWTIISNVRGWGPTNVFHVPGRIIAGRSMQANGVPATKVEVFEWVSKKLIITIIPNSDGTWHFSETNYSGAALEYMIVHHGQVGFKPQIDGPIKPYSYIT